jgi:hypothetical protein
MTDLHTQHSHGATFSVMLMPLVAAVSDSGLMLPSKKKLLDALQQVDANLPIREGCTQALQHLVDAVTEINPHIVAADGEMKRNKLFGEKVEAQGMLSPEDQHVMDLFAKLREELQSRLT